MRNDVKQHRHGKFDMSRRGLLGAGIVGGATLALGGMSSRQLDGEVRGSVDLRLEKLGIALPAPAAAVATYAPFRIVGNMVYVAGQGPALDDDANVFGKLGSDLTVAEGVNAARLAAISVLSQAKAACSGDLDRIVQWVRLTGFVNSTDDFIDQPKVLNGASDLLVDVFGEKGLHARAAIGVNSLPFNIAVEIEATFQIRV